MDMPDWGLGRYELTAAHLLPAAEQLVATAKPRARENVLDLGCGTGSVALLAAQASAQVIGIDPSARLLHVARAAAAEQDLVAEFAIGATPGIPVDDASQDAVLSNFALIFAPDPAAAVADVARVLRPGGRIVFSAWVPGSTIDRAVGVAMRTVAEAAPHTAPRGPGFSWHQPASVTTLFAATGREFDVRVTEHQLAYRAASAQAYVDQVHAVHPMAVAARNLLEAAGVDFDVVRRATLDVLNRGNEDPAAFQVTSRYLIYDVRESA